MNKMRISLGLAIAAVLLIPSWGQAQPKRQAPRACPPFFLRDSMGNEIDPFKWEQELEDWKKMMGDFGDGAPTDPNVYGMSIPPYSPRRTCGECHKYSKITAGYHFRMGSDVLHDDYGANKDDPWSISDGTCGKFSRMYFLHFPPKHFNGAKTIDMGLYTWASRCGTCHPGGGPLEFDRNGHRLDDYDPRGAESSDGDYYGAHWDLSGALEADCLFCHLETYSYQERYEQIQALNFRWAPTAGAALGKVNGSIAAYLGSLENPDVETLPLPTVEYNKSLFLPDGRVQLPIKRPSDRNCLLCHDLSFTEKHGTTFGDTYSVDVHSKRGIRCIDCHPGGLHHNFAKGDSHELSVRDDLDGTAHTCEECHTVGHLGAPEMVHKGLPPIHLEKIGCEVCHVPTLHVAAIGMVDASLGRPITIISSEGPWFGYREEEMTLVPLRWAEIRDVIEKLVQEASASEKEGLKDANGDGLPDFDTEEEILKALQALYQIKEFQERQLIYMIKTKVQTFATAFEAFLVYELQPNHTSLTYEVFRDVPEMPKWRPKYGEVVAEWRPVYATDESGKIRAYNNQTAVWWGHKEGDIIVPLFLREISESVDAAVVEANPKVPVDVKLRNAFLDKDFAKDNDGDGKPEINTEAEIANFSALLRKHLTGKRFEKPNPVLVSGSKVYEAAEDGTVKSYEHPQAKPVLWSVSHNVAPRGETLGAGDRCEECHSPDSYFFFGKVLLDPYSTDAEPKPVKIAMAQMMGYPDARPDSTPVIVRTSAFFKWLTIITITLLVLHILADLIRRTVGRKGN